MHTASDGHLIFAATDLSNFLACHHLTQKALATALGGPKPPKFDDPGAEVLRQRGQEHERIYLEGLRESGDSVASIVTGQTNDLSTRWEQGARDTVKAMRAGADVIYQGVLFDGTWLGLPDFLRRVDTPSAFGPWSYEVVDAKLAREAKGGAVLQISLYSDLLTGVQERAPDQMHLALGGPEAPTESFRVADYGAYYRSVRARFEAAVGADTPLDVYPEPTEHCDICAWKTVCATRRREDDHLSLVAGITRRQREQLEQRGIATLQALSELPLPLRPALEGANDAAVERIREQARIQVEGRSSGEPRYELLTPVIAEQGLAILPEPSPGDLFFDIEGDRHALADGLEYLFGYADRTGQYTAMWALDREEEKRMFERFIDSVIARLREHPDMHVFHYAPYETTAVKRLMGLHATREDEVDRLLRGGVFVDLYRAVRQGVRASVESYSIKKMEPFYGFERAVDLRSASLALGYFEAWLALSKSDESDTELLGQIEGYNRDDCLSTLRLQEWLERLRAELADLTGSEIPRPAPAEGAPSEAVEEQQERIDQLIERLTADVPTDELDRSTEQHARWLLAQLLGWHRREKKSIWWEYFRRRELTDEEFIEDRSTVGGLEYEGVCGTVKRSTIHRYKYPAQEHAIRRDSKVVDPATEGSPGRVDAVDLGRRTIDLTRGNTSDAPHPTALIPHDVINDGVLRDSLMRLGEWVAERGIEGDGPFRAARDLLLRTVPRVGQPVGAPLVGSGEELLDAGKRLAKGLDNSVLPVQGPPGAGKTYTGARMIVELLREGKRVGVTATSHKVIGNLLDEVCSAGAEVSFEVTGVQKTGEDNKCNAAGIEACTNDGVLEALTKGTVKLAAGTGWLWAREEMMNSVDVLFVDEAGQMALANVLAVSPSAKSMVLLGDPQQLEQPQMGSHPPGAEASALEHILGEHSTVPADRGLFLNHTWRLHPKICAYTSEIFYEGRLESRPGLEAQEVGGPVPLRGSGLRFVPVEHSGNRNESPEEVARVVELTSTLLECGTWADQEGRERQLGLDDILVVSPYNAQVGALAAALPEGSRVGTVDKFQGQEAPVVIYSMASSSAAEAPRGMEFLFNPNRLNVATSRARCLAIVVASPDLFAPECRSPRQMRLANAFCRLLEVAAEPLDRP